MMSKILVSIILNGYENDKAIFACRSALVQEYDNLSFLILGNRDKCDFNYERLFELINYSDKEIEIYFANDGWGEEFNCEQYAIHYAEKIGAEYIVFLKNSSWFYDANSIAKVFGRSNSNDAYTGINLLYDEQGWTGKASGKRFVISARKLHAGIIYRVETLKRKKLIMVTNKACNYISHTKLVSKIDNRKLDKNSRPISGQLSVVFFAQNYSEWPSLQSVYEFMSKDVRFDPLIVYVKARHENSEIEKVERGIEKYKDYKIIPEEEYDILKHLPDIAFYTVPYSFVSEKYTIDYVSKIVPRCIWIPYGMTLESEVPELIRLRYKIAMQYLAWKVICDDEFGVELAKKYAWNKAINFVPLGNPRIDLIRAGRTAEEKIYYEKVKKLARDRKVVLWNTHHSITEDCSHFSSWTKFGNDLLDYWYESKEYFVIWRPHPLFYEALRKYVGDEEYTRIMNRIDENENILLDDNPSYLPAFKVADLMVSDASSLIKEFLYLDKPIIWTTGNKAHIINPDIIRCLSIPDNMADFCSTLAGLASGVDLHSGDREQYLAKYDLKIQSVAKRIVDYIYDEIQGERGE